MNGRFIILNILMLFLITAGLKGQNSNKDKFIVIAPDNWTFQYDGTNERFIPFGTNFFDSRRVFHPPGKPGIAPFAVITKFNYESADSLLVIVENLGANIIRIFLSVRPLFPDYKKVNEENFKVIDNYVALAKKHNIRVILDPLDGWERYPEWMRGDMFADERILEGQEFIMEEFGKRYKDEPAIFAYDLINEPTVSSGWSPIVKEKFGEWLRKKYRNEKTLKKYWIDYPFAGETWDTIKIPASYPNPENRRLYDFQIFREEIAANWVKRLSAALKRYDRRHFLTVGLVQMSAPLYRLVHNQNFGIFGYPAFNPQKIAPYVDYMSIHGYNWWDDKEEYFLEGVVRYAYVGKPVMLEEFRFMKRYIDHLVGSTSGWLNWSAFWVGSIRWLYNLREDRVTDAGIEFKEKASDLTFFTMDRKLPADYVVVDRLALLTNITYAEELYFRYLDKRFKSGSPIDFRFINEELSVEYEE